MNTTLDREDLINMILGTTGPSYEIMDKYTKLGIGGYVGGFIDSWRWDRCKTTDTWNSLDENTLLELYIELKNCFK